MRGRRIEHIFQGGFDENSNSVEPIISRRQEIANEEPVCDHLPERQEAQPWRGGLSAHVEHVRRGRRERHRGMGTRRSPSGPRQSVARTRRARADGLGDTIATEDRPHCPSMADPALHRSWCGLPVRRARRSIRRGRSFPRNANRCRRCLLEKSHNDTVHVQLPAFAAGADGKKLLRILNYHISYKL